MSKHFPYGCRNIWDLSDWSLGIFVLHREMYEIFLITVFGKYCFFTSVRFFHLIYWFKLPLLFMYRVMPLKKGFKKRRRDVKPLQSALLTTKNNLLWK